MANSYRIRTQVGVDKSIQVYLDQDFEFLEILSLKILQSQIYTRPCSDYGVVVGRVSVNGGFGIPNAKVSIFIPLSPEDEENPIISELYPYKTVLSLNEDGYRYNLLPYVQQHGGHTPTGTFFDREDVLIDNTLIQVYDKYYKYTARTNDSGDYMIFGVPIGSQNLHVDIDLSDIGEFSLFPQDLIRMGRASENQVAGTRFKSSNNLNELPQIVSVNRTVQVEPLWGQEDFCNIGITRTDIDLSDLNIKIEPTAIFMGSIISSGDDQAQKRNCKPRLKQGNLCSLVTGPGEILAIRQTIYQDINGRPGLEKFDLDQGGQVIDDNGTWMVDVPMNLDYVITNEFGQQVLSNDPSKGIPTKARYRFKVKWNQTPTLREPIKRGYFLVPNIKEYGWNGPNVDPLIFNTVPPAGYPDAINSYAFSLDWNDYGDTGTTLGQQMIQEAISCEDRFYEFTYNKVYTVSQFIDQFRTGYFSNRIIAIKDILEDTCQSENNKFPTNDSNLRWDILFLLFLIIMYPMRIVLYVLIILMHIVAFIVWLLGIILTIVVIVVFPIVILICEFINLIISAIETVFDIGGNIDCPDFGDMFELIDTLLNLYKYFTNISIPNLTYPDCELCSCTLGEQIQDNPATNPLTSSAQNIVTTSGVASFISKYYDSARYIFFGGRANPSTIAEIMSGYYVNNNFPSSYSRAPQSAGYSNGVLFTTSLTIGERLNLFNTKAKYFNASPLNPGGGVNRVKVTFQPDLNAGQNHYDNMLVVSFTENTLSKFPAGKIISFQDPLLSKDKNLTGFTQTNQFGNKAITGTTVGTIVGTGTNAYTTSNVTVSFANPNGGGNSATTYTITGKTDDANYHRFPIDIEYFQVVTAMTYSSYAAQTGGSIPNSLATRILNNDMKFELINSAGCWDLVNSASFVHNPITTFDEGNNQVLVFLIRGVDPNSTTCKVKYDMSILFGKNYGNVEVEGQYKLNIPIQGKYRPASHTDFTADAFLPSDTYGNIPLYYDSYHFQPAITGLASFSSFTSNLPSYYSSLSMPNTTFAPSNPGTSPLSAVLNGSTEGYRANTGVINGFTQSFLPPTPPLPYPQKSDCESPPLPCNILNRFNNTSINRGYFQNEIVDGGSFLRQDLNITQFNYFYCGSFSFPGYCYSPRYNVNITYPTGLGTNGRQIVMRTDRLPTSTTTQDVAGNSYVLQHNSKFMFFDINENGVNQSNAGTVATAPSVGATEDSQPENVDPNIFDSFTCAGLVPLTCYDTNSMGEIVIKPKPDGCYENQVDGQEIMKNGCYVFVTSILLTLINGRDFTLLTEWMNRLQINFAACRNVWSHLFTNNWINGTLFAFSINNDRFFTEPNSSNPNKPYSLYCRKTMLLHPTTSNYYYRSSPYDGYNFNFVGGIRPQPNLLSTPYGGNFRNILFPTTIMDLGPKNAFVQELVMSDEYDGYVINKLPQTTFGDTSEILNLFIITRLTNSSFLQSLVGGGGASVFNYFNERTKLMVDADFAQSISVNSELGVAPFQAESYPTSPGGLQDPIFYNGGNTDDGLFGIFFSSDTQVRDWITPKRTIIVQSAQTNSVCAFNNYGVFSQVVPFYQWDIKPNSGGSSTPLPDSIFGSQKNNWHTDANISGSGFFKYRYQSMDRLDVNSRYFRTSNVSSQYFYKGYIYSVTPTSTFANPDLDPKLSSWDFANNPDPRKVTVGAPFHFYFGLKKGKTAWDRFARKWLDLESIEIDG